MVPTCSITVLSHHWGPISVMAAIILAWSTPRAQSCHRNITQHRVSKQVNITTTSGLMGDKTIAIKQITIFQTRIGLGKSFSERQPFFFHKSSQNLLGFEFKIL
jgi:hypothetical protein